MDWFSWLSKTDLNPSLVYEYGLSFSRNELEQEDIYYFTHEFLQSMGISIAKHRLEILKLAGKENKELAPKFPPVSRLFSVIKNARSYFARHMRAVSLCEDPALAIVPRQRNHSTGRLRSAALKKSQKLGLVGNSMQGRLLLTNGSETPMVASATRPQSFSSPLVYAIGEGEKLGASDQCWSDAAVEEMRWDTMFQDLKPT